MYYPIIDKLKEIMTDITSVKEKEPLIINATINNDASGGTWQGDYDDIINSLINGRQVILKGAIPSSSPHKVYANVSLALTESDPDTGDLPSVFSNVFMFTSGSAFVQIWPDHSFDINDA